MLRTSVALLLLLLGKPLAQSADFNLPIQPSLSLTHGVSNTTITYRGQTNYQYILYGSTNSTTWVVVVSNLCTNPQMNSSDPNRPNRFYKATSWKMPQIYECTLSWADMGSFLLFARTNDTVALLGTTSMSPGEYANSLPIGINNRYAGALLTGRTGLLSFTSNTVSGSLSNGTSRTGAIAGALKANSGIFQGSAGIYTGSLSGACGGTIRLALCADGTLYLYISDNGAAPDGGSTVLTSPSFTVLTPRGTHYFGTLNNSTRTINGTFSHGCASAQDPGSFFTSRGEKLF